ncbi:Crp/Fnr family transcriptional regulator [Litorimonas sp. WD9-15]|uniref:Crp/Fnr family transcriptional regulator n=1 Tax=Litorimonas sp. WD9-15 TaxID=3418716 RepID=UPI003CFF6754
MAGEFLKKLEIFAELSEAEANLYRSLTQTERTLNENQTLLTDGAPQSNLYVVKSGWFYSYAILPDGSRQVHGIFTAGDVIGTEHLSWGTSMSSVAAASDGVVYQIPVKAARQFLMDNPRLNAIFYALHMVHNGLLLDRITAVSRLGAYQKLAYFLADTLIRQNLILETETDILHLPLSQNFVADCLGLSSVHVSRQVGKLIKNGIIEKQGRYDFRVLDRDALLKLSDYTDRFADIASSNFDANFSSDHSKGEFG